MVYFITDVIHGVNPRIPALPSRPVWQLLMSRLQTDWWLRHLIMSGPDTCTARLPIICNTAYWRIVILSIYYWKYICWLDNAQLSALYGDATNTSSNATWQLTGGYVLKPIPNQALNIQNIVWLKKHFVCEIPHPHLAYSRHPLPTPHPLRHC